MKTLINQVIKQGTVGFQTQLRRSEELLSQTRLGDALSLLELSEVDPIDTLHDALQKKLDFAKFPDVYEQTILKRGQAVTQGRTTINKDFRSMDNTSRLFAQEFQNLQLEVRKVDRYKGQLGTKVMQGYRELLREQETELLFIRANHLEIVDQKDLLIGGMDLLRKRIYTMVKNKTYIEIDRAAALRNMELLKEQIAYTEKGINEQLYKSFQNKLIINEKDRLVMLGEGFAHQGAQEEYDDEFIDKNPFDPQQMNF